jgi:hypothetical protein
MNVFVTYNPKSRLERTLAIRVHTIGGVHGYKMYFPDRTKGDIDVSLETKQRIMISNYWVHFSPKNTKPSETILSEMELAKEQNVEIIVISAKASLAKIAEHEIRGLLLVGIALLWLSESNVNT